MFFTPLRPPPPPGIYNSYRILAIFLLFRVFRVFLWGGGVGGPPRSVEQVTSRTGTSPLTIYGPGITICMTCLTNWFFIPGPYFGGGGSVRMRNALHEVGGRSLRATTRVLKARADRETHTHFYFIIIHISHFLINIILSPTHTK
jgi:hypothetical protein